MVHLGYVTEEPVHPMQLKGEFGNRVCNMKHILKRCLIRAKYGIEVFGWRCKEAREHMGWTFGMISWKKLFGSKRIGFSKLEMVLEFASGWIFGAVIQPSNSVTALLQILFHSSIWVSSYKNEIAEVKDQTVGNRSWNLKFTRYCNDWEVNGVVHLLSVLHEEQGG